MKKILLAGCLILITACQPATTTPVTSLFPTSTPLPSPAFVFATVSPEPSPTLELSPTPFPSLFTEEFDSIPAGWAILQGGNESVPNIKTDNGSLILEMDSTYTWLYALYGAQDYSTVHMATQFTSRAMSPSSVGLICGYSEESGWLEYNVSTDGTYNVLYGKWLSPGVVDYAPITDGTSKEIQRNGMTQTIGLTCAEKILSLFIKDKLIRKVDVTNYDVTGKIGLAAASYENSPVTVGFDWVKVSQQ
jgi:hypothetical protein